MSFLAPPLVIVWGPAGSGKTTDVGRAVPNALFVATKGALVPLKTALGFSPPEENILVVDPRTGDLSQVRSLVDRALSRLGDRCDAIVVDDVSLIALRTVRLLEKKGGPSGRGLNKLQAYGEFRLNVNEICDEWRHYGFPVIVTAHENPPSYATDDNGNRLGLEAIGGPSIPGSKGGPEMVKSFDISYRVMPAPAAPLDLFADHSRGSKGAQWNFFRYAAGPYSPSANLWDTKDRWSVACAANHGTLPMNLGEILRFAAREHGLPFRGSRPPGCEWIEPYIGHVLEKSQGDKASREALGKAVVQKVHREKSAPLWQLHWFLRDLEDRVEIASAHDQSAELAALGIGPES